MDKEDAELKEFYQRKAENRKDAQKALVARQNSIDQGAEDDLKAEEEDIKNKVWKPIGLLNDWMNMNVIPKLLHLFQVPWQSPSEYRLECLDWVDLQVISVLLTKPRRWNSNHCY